MRHLSKYANHKVNELTMFKSNAVKVNDVIKLFMDNGIILTVKKLGDYVPDDKPVWEILSVDNESEFGKGYVTFTSLPDKTDILPIGSDSILKVGTKIVTNKRYISIFNGRSTHYYCEVSRILLNDKEVKRLDITK